MAGLLPSSGSTCRLRWTLGTRAAAAPISCCSCWSASLWPAGSGRGWDLQAGLRQEIKGSYCLSCANGHVKINGLLAAGHKRVSSYHEVLQPLQRLTMAYRGGEGAMKQHEVIGVCRAA